MGYVWDLFISYPRRAPIGPWVHDRFLPLLRLWLGAAMPTLPKIFVDAEIPSGSHWPSRLADALLRSKHMLAVVAPPYFGSSWCMSEWQTMKEREARLGLGHGGAPGLMRVIRFFDGDTFPAEAKAVQADDYTAYNKFPPGNGVLKSKPYREFETRVQTLCLELAARIAAPPQWDASWPVLQSPQPQYDASLSFDSVALAGAKK